jgi:predicted negative regulator of RcsB-dependent stress response
MDPIEPGSFLMSYLTDDEKAEAIKKWWSDNWSAIAGGLVLGVAGLLSWNWWTDREDTRTEQASQMYTQMLVQINQSQLERATLTGNQLVESAGRTPYLAMAWALRADIAAREGDPEAVTRALLEARKAARDDGFKEVLTLRLARHQLAVGDIAAALDTLAQSSSDAFAGLRAEIMGDVARVQGDHQQARLHYLQAQLFGHDTEFLRLKLDEVSG